MCAARAVGPRSKGSACRARTKHRRTRTDAYDVPPCHPQMTQLKHKDKEVQALSQTLARQQQRATQLAAELEKSKHARPRSASPAKAHTTSAACSGGSLQPSSLADAALLARDVRATCAPAYSEARSPPRSLADAALRACDVFAGEINAKKILERLDLLTRAHDQLLNSVQDAGAELKEGKGRAITQTYCSKKTPRHHRTYPIAAADPARAVVSASTAAPATSLCHSCHPNARARVWVCLCAQVLSLPASSTPGYKLKTTRLRCAPMQAVQACRHTSMQHESPPMPHLVCWFCYTAGPGWQLQRPV